MEASEVNRFNELHDIDAGRKLVHIRRGNGHKDRMVLLPDLTRMGLRELWKRHHHPALLCPNAVGSIETIQKAQSHMDRGGAQNAMKVVVAECGIKKNLYTFLALQLCHPFA